MKILITGGAGYIGTELLRALLRHENNYQITIYDNLSRGNYGLFLDRNLNSKGNVKFVKGELLDSRKLSKELQDCDFLYHLAAKVSTPFADHNPHEFDQINNWGTSELIQITERSNVQNMVFLSSVSVYGSSDRELTVNDALAPKTFYSISKMHGEQHVMRLLNSNINTMVVRCANVYGFSPSMRFDSVINKFMFEAQHSNRIRIFGDGTQERNFIEIGRLTDALANLAAGHFYNGIYNWVEGQFSILDLARALKTIYPSLETTFVNQNMPIRSLKAKGNGPFSNIGFEQLCKDFAYFKSNFGI